MSALGVGLASGSSFADPMGPRASDAEARFREGSQAFDGGRIEEACADFAESSRLYPALGTLLNLALCHEKQGKTATAWREFSHAAAWASQDATPDRRDFARQHAVRLERSLSRILIELGFNENAFTIEVDGVPLEAWGTLPVFLDPGEHVVTADAPARTRYTTRVTVPLVAKAEPIIVRVPPLELQSVDRPALPLPAVVSAAPHAAPRVAALIVGGAGSALVLAGVFFGIDALSKTNELRSCNGCDTGPVTTSEELSILGFGGGIAGLVAGALLFYSPSPKWRPAPSHAHLGAAVRDRSASLELSGIW